MRCGTVGFRKCGILTRSTTRSDSTPGYSRSPTARSRTGRGHGVTRHRERDVSVLPVDRNLGEQHYRANVPVVDQQLAKAGVRLAKLLNEALGKK